MDDYILVVRESEKDNILDKIHMRGVEHLEMVTTDSPNFPEGKAIIMPREMFKDIDTIDFSKAQLPPSEPYRFEKLPEFPDMSGYFKEQERQQKAYQRETLKNISRIHSRIGLNYKK